MILILNSINLFSQVWTTRSPEGDRDAIWTVLSKEQYDRLLNQSYEMYNYCSIWYTDIIDKSPSKAKVVSGTRPIFNGYYYLSLKIIPRDTMSNIDKKYFELYKRILIYGNTNTGEMELQFGDSPLMIDVHNAIYLGKEASKIFNGGSGWDRYIKKYNQYLGYVNRKY